MATIDFDLPCLHCSGNLRGADVTGVCPHCQMPVAHSINTRAIDPASMTVAADVSCAGCGYNLRTLWAGAVCPECAKPVVQSLRADDLHFADVRWLRRVRSGVGWLLVAVLGVVALLAWVSVTGGSGSSAFAAVGGLLLSVVCLACGGFGVFGITSPEPNSPAGVRGRGAGIAGRWLGVGSPVLLVLMYGPLGPLESAAGVRMILLILATLGIPACALCTLVYLRSLARRAKKSGLARLSSVLIWLIVTAGASTAISICLVIYIGSRPGPPPRGGAGWAGYVATSQPAGTTLPVTTTTGPTAPAAPPSMLAGAWVLAFTAAFLAASILGLACYVIGVILLFRYRALLGAMISREQPLPG